jgi:hypothetical protein
MKKRRGSKIAAGKPRSKIWLYVLLAVLVLVIFSYNEFNNSAVKESSSITKDWFNKFFGKEVMMEPDEDCGNGESCSSCAVDCGECVDNRGGDDKRQRRSAAETEQSAGKRNFKRCQ